ncbi:MAG: amidohydrolase family protein, partial [Pirellulales bacterium]|nr:amidohydrolase family protein [Pirellulales bacterium]
ARRAIAHGIDVFDVLQAACLNPIDHYGLEVGQLRVGDPADFIETSSITQFDVLRTWIDGQIVAENGASTLPRHVPEVVNQFEATYVDPEQLVVENSADRLQVIEAVDGQLITSSLLLEPAVVAGRVVSDVQRDILKLVVVNRYQAAPPAVAFIKNFGLRQGAMASSVAHDSHNVIAVGVNDSDLAEAINAIMSAGGGLSACCQADRIAQLLPLPIAGLMATGTCAEVGAAYQQLDGIVKRWGSPLRAPYMTLSFMALLVIPNLKLSDRGLFDSAKFEFTPLFSGSASG